MYNPIQQPEWQQLQQHQAHIALQHMRFWFANEPQRFRQFSLSLGDILFDYSKNRITEETLSLLIRLAEAAHLHQKITDQFQGLAINTTENRPALHTALRSKNHPAVFVNSDRINPAIQGMQEKMRQFIEKVRSEKWRGATGQPIRHIVNIGIGGSHLGPMTAVHALADFTSKQLQCHFISNIDSHHLHAVLDNIQPENTLFIISSKSFSTLETLTNAHTIRNWLQQSLGHHDLSAHFVAITAAAQKARQFGIPDEQIFPLWNWIGGRYSVWSAIGLPLALMIGMENFCQFLQGAHEVDQHFLQSDLRHNIPVLMALLSVWYTNFFSSSAHVITPYSHRLHYLPNYLQQAEMESNGKSITHDGQFTEYMTGPVLFGDQGCNGQHAYHQLLHQGTHLIPTDFILVGEPADKRHPQHHDILIASALSQAQAMMQGKTYEEARQEALAEGL